MRTLCLLPLALAATLQAQEVMDAAGFNAFIQAEHPHAGPERSGGPPTRGYDLNYMRCSWSLDPAVRFIGGTVTAYFTATAELGQLVFDLSDSLVVDSVTRNGDPLAFIRVPGDLLEITLPSIIPAGQLDSVTVTYHGVPPNTGFGSFVTTTHDTILNTPVLWTLSEPYGAKDWWPCKQDLNDKIDSLDTFVTTPGIYRAAGNGLLMAPDTIGDRITWHWRHRYPIDYYLIATAVTNYQVDLQYAVVDGDSIPMLTYAYPENFGTAVANATNLLPKLVLFSQLFGTYPFAEEKYGHAQIGWGGGMEHQTMTFLGVYHSEISSHELGHQWFGDKVTCASWQEIWLNEGFATYLSGLAYEHLNPVLWPIWKRAKVNNITSEPGGSVFCTDTTTNARLFDGRLTYNKGAMVINMLRWVCGDSAFYQGLRAYLNDPALAYGSATTADLKAHLEASSGVDLTDFFNDWYLGEGYPSYTTAWSQADDGQVSVTLSQTTSHPSVDFFELPVPVRLYGGGMDSTVVLDNTGNDQVYSFHLPFDVDSVLFDPDIWLISANNVLVNVDELNGDATPPVVFPNPAGDHITWSFHNPRPMTVQVLDALGRTVISAGNYEHSLDISGLSSGSYLLELRDSNMRFCARFIKY